MPARTVLIATQSAELALALERTLAEAGYEVRIVAGPGEAGEEFAGCALIDWDMGEALGRAMLSRIESLGGIPAIILTSAANQRSALRALKDGAADLLEHPADPDELFPAIEQAMARAAHSLKLAQDIEKASRILLPLSQREQHIVMGIVAGLTSREIAEVVAVSVRTVETTRTRLLAKLGVPNTAALVRLAVLGGLVPPSAALPGRAPEGRAGVSR